MQNLNEELSRLKQMMGINPSDDLINEEKADRCLRIARRKYDKPSAYRSGAIVRCRQGMIWKGLKENWQDTSWENEKGQKITLPQLLDTIKNYPVKNIPIKDIEKIIIKKNTGGIESDRLDKADTQHPIIIVVDDNNNLKYVLDGNHRANKAIDNGLKSIPAKLVNIKKLPQEFQDVLTEDESLRKWFSRKGAPGKKGGWVDCNTCREVDGKTKCKACGREKGEKRAKYPSCRPTPAQCKSSGKGKKWGKTKNESINESDESLKRVALLFIVLDNKALLFKRSKYETTNPSKYGMLGGHIEKGETPEEALKREIKEEAGVELLSFKPLNVYNLNESVELNVFYTNEFDIDNIDLNENEHTSYRFFTMEQMVDADPEKMISTNKDIANDYNEIVNEELMLQEQLNKIKRFL